MKWEYREGDMIATWVQEEDGTISLTGLSAKEGERAPFTPAVEVQLAGYTSHPQQVCPHTGSGVGDPLALVSCEETETEDGRQIAFRVANDILAVTQYYRFYNGVQAVRCWAEAENIGSEAVTLTYLGSLSLTLPNRDGTFLIPHNAWCAEMVWEKTEWKTPAYFPKNECADRRMTIRNTGSHSTEEYLPMGSLTTPEGVSYLWQIENNGSWCWTAFGSSMGLFLRLSGPAEDENGWYKVLQPGESFTSVPVAMTLGNSFDEALGEMTKYRRRMRHITKADSGLPVIFNDYMNCLLADPTEEKLLPVIDAAAKAGAEIFCTDAGWYAEGSWWPTIGEWQPSHKRFPHGLEAIADYVASKGMRFGLWIEIESFGIACPLVKEFPDEAFFCRHGKRVVVNDRYQLDFRSPIVREYADGVIDRLVTNYRLGYMKMDYNIEAGIGTEIDADSFGDGLLEANRAFLSWVKGVQERHPDLILENCGSGGLRMDYAMLSRYSVQSTSDQTNYLRTAPIAAAAATGVLPECAAVWSYPITRDSAEEAVFNMVNAMLTRIHLSGRIFDMEEEPFRRVQEGVAIYKKIREEIPSSLPFYPLGLPSACDDWLCAGYRSEKHSYLAVWRMAGEEEKTIPLPFGAKEAVCLYGDGTACLSAEGVTVHLPQDKTAMIIQIKERSE